MVDLHMGLGVFAAACLVVGLFVSKTVWIRVTAMVLGMGLGAYWLLSLFTDDPARAFGLFLG